MYGVLDISTSGLIAQRSRLTLISNNLANSRSIENENGGYEPYRRRQVVLAPGDGGGGRLGVHVAEVMDDMSPLNARLEPGHKFADDKGYVYYPNVNSVVEQMDAMEAYRAYEANIAAAEATKSMMTVALRLMG